MELSERRRHIKPFMAALKYRTLVGEEPVLCIMRQSRSLISGSVIAVMMTGSFKPFRA